MSRELAQDDVAMMDHATRAHEEDLRETWRLIFRLLLNGPDRFTLTDLARLREVLGRLAP